MSVFNDTIDYLKTLKCDGSTLILGERKMFILVFIVTMSYYKIAYKLLYISQSPLKFVLTNLDKREEGLTITQIVSNSKKV